MIKGLALAIALAMVSSHGAGDYGAVFRNMGYVPSKEPVEVVEVAIPADWDGVYSTYNALQKEGGFDLEPWKGRTCTRYTYLIPEYNARGNVLVYNGIVIGGDICSITLDGIMLPIERNKLR